MAAVDPDAGEGRGSGGTSLAGYDYQIDVSVWLALDLVLASQLTPELVLEPASEEDLEAELTEHEPGRVTSKAPFSDYTLVVQVKLRTGDAWTVAGLKTLLKHGSEGRVSAAKRLEDGKVRYLLVTSSGLNGGAARLRVRRAGNWPKASEMPASLKEALPDGAAGRVAVIGAQEEDRLAGDIERLLVHNFRVPYDGWRACFEALRKEARLRVLGGGAGRWRREELQAVIRAHEGYIASSPELEHYVHPTNWGDLVAAMRERGAALIIGQSGTGKTLATLKLYEELRLLVPGLRRVPIKLGPHQLRDDPTEGPVLYDIEDPWGRFDFDPNSRPWNDQLAQFMSQARPNRMIVATSRLDVAQASKALGSVKAYLVPLEAEHYGQAQRARLYRTRVPALPRDLQLLAANSQAEVLAELATPLEIQKFFDALPTLDRKGLRNPPGFISRAIRKAHQDSIELTVREQIEQRNDVRAAAVLWGLLKAVDKVSQGLVRTLEDALAERDPNMSEGISPLIGFFVAARNLRQADDVVTYYHPRVEAGIEQALAGHAPLVRQTLRRLADILVSDDGPGPAWGAGAAARLLAATGRKSDLAPQPTVLTTTRVDAWLADQVAQGATADFERLLDMAADAGSETCAVAELARYLAHRPDKSFPGITRWGEPRKDAAWRDRLRADPVTAPLLSRYIREVLPDARVSFPLALVTKLDRLADDLTPAYLAAARASVGAGVLMTDAIIAAGALRDRAGFEPVLDAAIAERTPSASEQAAADQRHLDLLNGVYSDEYAEHLSESEEGYTAQRFISAYAAETRAQAGWRAVAAHRHAAWLRAEWFGLLLQDAKAGKADQEEIEGAVAAGDRSDDEGWIWQILAETWQPHHLPGLKARILEGDSGASALACLVAHAPAELMAIAQNLLEAGARDRLVQIALDLAGLRRRRSDEDDEVGVAAQAAGHLPVPFAAISEAELALMEDRAPALDAAALQALSPMAQASEEVRRFRVRVDVTYPLDVADDVRWLLAHSEDPDVATEALKAAVRRGLTAEIDQAIDHRFATVSAAAMTVAGQRIPAPLPPRLLTKVSDPGSPVRKALVALLQAKPHIEHLPTLLALARDTWSNAASYHGEDDAFPIARSAVAAIADLGQPSPDVIGDLYVLALETTDPTLRAQIFDLLAERGGLETQGRLLDQAITPGRAGVRRAAVHALLGASDALDAAVFARITPDLLASRAEVIAAALSVLVSWRGEAAQLLAAGQALATNADRRVLLVLMVSAASDRTDGVGRQLAGLLPQGHAAVTWALTGAGEVPNDAMLADLGSARACAAALSLINLPG